MATIALSQQNTIQQPSRLRLAFRYLRRNKSLLIGLLILLGLVLFTVIGLLTVDTSQA
jgi:peptide/nickel transport system permease protein